MKRWFTVSAALLLLGCDEPTVISHVDRLPGVSDTLLWAMQDGRGIPVEIHGAPFPDATRTALAEALRPPPGVGDAIRFHAADPGSWQDGHAARLVLHFNPAGPPNAQADCKRTEPALTGPEQRESFTVNAAFCRGTRWQAFGFMRVLQIKPGDMKAYSRAMTSLMMAIFQEEPDR